MKRKGSIFMALAVMIVGLVLVGAGVSMGGSSSLFITDDGVSFENPSKVEITSEQISSDINNVIIDVDYMDTITIVSGDSFSVEYDNFSTEVDVTDETLRIVKPSSSYSESSETAFVSVDFGVLFNDDIDTDSPYIILTIPREMQSIQISNRSGEVIVENIASEELDVFNNHGNISIADVISKDLTVQANSADIQLINVTSEEVEIYSNHSKTQLSGITAENVVIDQVSEDINLIDASIAERLEIVSNYSNIYAEFINPEAEHKITISSEYGRFSVNSQELIVPTVIGNGEREIDITTDSGDIELSFKV